MNAFTNYLCAQLEQMLEKRRVVVFYDPRSEFAPLFDRELEAIGSGADGLVNVVIGEELTALARFSGSFFALRAAVESSVARDEPGRLIVYLPGAERDRHGSILMELEKGGVCYEPQLKRQARTVLRTFYTDGDIDEMLSSDALTYSDVVAFVGQAESGGDASILRAIFGGASSEGLLVNWIATNERDGDIVAKGGLAELYRLVDARLGFSLPPDVTLSEARGRTVRYLLVNEFRSDLTGEPPVSVAMVPSSPSKEHRVRIQTVIDALRQQHRDQYAALADGVEEDLGLSGADIDPGCLGDASTFRFEEARLLTKAIELTATRSYQEALEILVGRAHSFWLDRELSRQAQWGACQIAAELGEQIKRTEQLLRPQFGDATAWVSAYSSPRGWFEVDRLRRRLETWVAQMDDEPEAERAIALVRHEHDELLKRMASGFSSALVAAEWSVPNVLHQTQIYPQDVQAAGGRIAYILVDALRYEMGVELSEQLQGVQELSVRPAVAALPTITPVGMAALLPGAASSFSVIDDRGKLCARVDGAVVPDLSARLKFFKSRVPGLVDMTLGKLLQTRTAKLASAISAAPLVLVRSQEIDLAGETDDDLFPRHVMDTSILNIARAVRKLAAAGVESFVITADHGHQFSSRKEEDMRTDSPGGSTVDIHRRCWAGRGGTTPPGTVRVSGPELGYETDLDFVFPTGLGVFKAGGGLTYHHGGISLQEIVIPVVTFRVPNVAEKKQRGQVVKLAGVPKELTNRTFGVRLLLVGDLLATEPIVLRIALISGDAQVGKAGMAVGGELDRAADVLTMQPGAEASLGIMLNDDKCESVRIVVLDPATDAVLAQSETIPVRLAI
jgi:hypothetical protein